MGVHAAVVAGVSVRRIQAGFGGHQRPGHRAAVASVRLQSVVLRLGHEVVDGERVVEGVVVRVGGVVVRLQVRGLVQQQRVVLVMVVVGEQVLRMRVRERGGHAHGAGGLEVEPGRLHLRRRWRGGGGGGRGVGPAAAAGAHRAPLGARLPRRLLLTCPGMLPALEALLPPEVAAVLEHVPRVRVQGPEGALPRFVR